MPFGPSALGVVYFTGVKLAGYSAAGAYLNRRAETRRPAALIFGVARTALGVAAGVTYGYALSRLSVSNTEFVFYAGLVPVRVLEWLAIIWFFYRAAPKITTDRARYVAQGIGWSYVLDLPAVLAAFAIPGGFWIC